MAGRGLSQAAALAAELGDLKRLRDARDPDSFASRLFARAWRALVAGVPTATVADVVTADALAATRLGGIDGALLARVGLSAADGRRVLATALDDAGGFDDELRDAVGMPLEQADAPNFVDALIRQPRAGATSPGKRRIVLEPPENHGDHCLCVAVVGALLADEYGCDRATPFLAGLVHHAHNAVLPDSGFAGETLLGDHLSPVMARLFDEAYAAMPPLLGAACRAAMRQAGSAKTPAGRAFNAADVIDRVVQQQHYADVAGFTLDRALDDLHLVHAGPMQKYQNAVLAEAGLR